MTTPEEIARIAECQRIDWIKTVLVIPGTEPQRRAFLRGYNGAQLSDISTSPSPRMRENYALGLRVRDHLMKGKSDA